MYVFSAGQEALAQRLECLVNRIEWIALACKNSVLEQLVESFRQLVMLLSCGAENLDASRKVDAGGMETVEFPTLSATEASP